MKQFPDLIMMELSRNNSILVNTYQALIQARLYSVEIFLKMARIRK